MKLSKGGLYVKRLLAFVLALAVSVTLSTQVAAGLPSKIGSVHMQFAQSLEVCTLDGASIAKESLSDLTIEPSSELRIYLCGEGGAPLFFDQSDALMRTADITLSRLRAAQLTVAIAEGHSTALVQSLEFAYGNASVCGSAPYISLRFAQEVLDETSFSFVVELRMLGQPLANTAIPISGVLKPNYRSIRPGEVVVDVRDGAVALSQQDIPQVEFLIGNGVSIKAPIRQGDKFFGAAQLETLPLPSTVSEENATDPLSPVKAYHLRTALLDRSQYRVCIQDDTTFYVYDEDMRYLGTTLEDLPYSDTYYLSERMP